MPADYANQAFFGEFIELPESTDGLTYRNAQEKGFECNSILQNARGRALEKSH
jgi:hypothetical protein